MVEVKTLFPFFEVAMKRHRDHNIFRVIYSLVSTLQQE
jgi:hypothetical protein